HGLAAVAAVAMQMLEQVQRKGPPAIEQVDVALFHLQEIAAGEFIDEVEKAALLARRQKRGGANNVRDLGQGFPDFPGGIGKQRAQSSEQKHGRLPMCRDGGWASACAGPSCRRIASSEAVQSRSHCRR